MTSAAVEFCPPAPVGAGTWTAALVDRLSGASLPLEAGGWRGSAGRRANEVSEASLVLDYDYARTLSRRPILWTDELELRRDGVLEWVGPIWRITDDPDPDVGVTWEARDRMGYAARRWHWRRAQYTAESTRLFDVMLNAMDYGDPLRLRRDPRPNGVVGTLNVRPADKASSTLAEVGELLEWAVIGDTVRYGKINQPAASVMDEAAWGPDRPRIVADGDQRLSHVAVVTRSGHRIFYPSADPYDRAADVPLLVDTLDVGDLSPAEARSVARRLWLDRQGEIVLEADDNRPITADFPLRWTELLPGATVYGSVLGTSLYAQDAPIRLAGLDVDLADGVESGVLPTLQEVPGFDPITADLYEVGDVPGLVFPPDAVFPDSQGYDWDALLGFDFSSTATLDGSSPFDFDGAFDLGGLSGPTPGFVPVDFGTFDPIANIPGFTGSDFTSGDFGGGIPGFGPDPFAGCPPDYCCTGCQDATITLGPRIWRTSDLDGSASWVAESGEAATLHSEVVDGMVSTRGGILYGAAIGNALFLQAPGYTDMAVSSDAGELVVTMRMSKNWTGPEELDGNHVSYAQWYFFGDTPSGTPGEWGGPGYWNSTFDGVNPMVPAAGQLAFWDGNADPDPNNDLSDADAQPGWTAVASSVSGFATAWQRFTLHGGTGAMTVEMAADNDGVPGAWTTAATDTWDTSVLTGGPWKNFIEFNSWFIGGEPSGHNGIVIHDLLVQMGGATEMEFTAADTVGIPMPIEDVGWPTDPTGISATVELDFPGSNAITDHPGLFVPWEGQPAPSGSSSVGGALVSPLWVDGPVLEQPLILWSDHRDAGYIRRIEGIQPTEFYGLRNQDSFAPVVTPAPDDFSAGWCWGVVDLATVDDTFWAVGETVQQETPAAYAGPGGGITVEFADAVRSNPRDPRDGVAGLPDSGVLLDPTGGPVGDVVRGPRISDPNSTPLVPAVVWQELGYESEAEFLAESPTGQQILADYQAGLSPGAPSPPPPLVPPIVWQELGYESEAEFLAESPTGQLLAANAAAAPSVSDQARFDAETVDPQIQTRPPIVRPAVRIAPPAG